MRYELKTVAMWPVVRITFLISLVMGFILGLFVALLFAPMLAMMSSLGLQDSGLENVGFSMGAMILFLPILYALVHGGIQHDRSADCDRMLQSRRPMERRIGV